MSTGKAATASKRRPGAWERAATCRRVAAVTLGRCEERCRVEQPHLGWHKRRSSLWRKTLNSAARPKRKFTGTARSAHHFLDRMAQCRKGDRPLSADKHHKPPRGKPPQEVSAKDKLILKFSRKVHGAADVFWKRSIRSRAPGSESPEAVVTGVSTCA